MFAIGKLILPIAIALPLPLGPSHERLPADSVALARERILEAIQVVETGGLNRPTQPDGDGGRSIGPLQIGRLYWQDAVGFDPSIGGGYDDCRDIAYARKVVRAYMRRYVPDAWEGADAEVIARIHNGGPLGMTKRSTVRYWVKVRGVLTSLD